MRHIQKKDSPDFFQAFVRKSHPGSWEEIHRAEPPVYGDVCQALTEEQNNLCGYTEIPLYKGCTHIDHYYKRTLYPEKCFCWDNLILAGLDDGFGARFKDKRINSKGMYDEIFNPVMDHPEDYFEYTYLGEIAPKKNLPHVVANKANKTIEYFNLNSAQLVNKRRDMSIAVSSLEKGGLSVEAIMDSLASGGFVSLIFQLLCNRN